MEDMMLVIPAPAESESESCLRIICATVVYGEKTTNAT